MNQYSLGIMIWYVLLVIIPRVVCYDDRQEFYLEVPGRCSMTEGGRVLSGNHTETGGLSLMECAARCLSSLDCKSLDYSVTNGSCRQHGEVTADNCSNVIEARGYSHHDVVSNIVFSSNRLLVAIEKMNVII